MVSLNPMIHLDLADIRISIIIHRVLNSINKNVVLLKRIQVQDLVLIKRNNTLLFLLALFLGKNITHNIKINLCKLDQALMIFQLC